MAALDVVGVDLELGLGEELARLVEQQALADLVAVGLLRPGLTRILPWKTPVAPARSTFLNTCRLSQPDGAVGDEDGVVVEEVAVADAGAGDVRDRVVAGHLDRRTRCG